MAQAKRLTGTTGRPRVIREIPVNNEPEGMPLDEVYTADPLNEALQALYAEMGISGDTDATVHVTQLQNDGSPEANIWRGDPSDYDLENLVKKFGSGQYRVKIYVRVESGGKPLKANRIFSWKLTAAEDAAIKAGIAAQPVASQLPQVLTPESIAAAIRMAMPPPAPQVNPMAMMKDIADVIKTMMPAPVAAPAAQINPMEIITTFAGLLRERGDNEPLERGVNANGADIFLRLIDKFAPLFEKTLSGTVIPQLSAPVAQPGQPEQPAPASAQSREDEAMLRLKMGLAFLVMQAEADNDPTTYADVVLDNVPDESVKMLVENAQWLDYLAQFEPRVRRHAKWFEALREEVIEALKPDEETPPTAGADAGTAAPLTPPAEGGKTAE